MEEQSLRSLLRAFFQLQTNTFFLTRKGRLIGYIHRSDLIEILSDLSVLQEDSLEVDIRDLTSEEEALGVFESEAIEQNNKKVMPVVNASWELTGFLTRAEVLQNFAAIQTPKEWNPPVVKVQASKGDEPAVKQTLRKIVAEIEEESTAKAPTATAASPVIRIHVPGSKTDSAALPREQAAPLSEERPTLKESQASKKEAPQQEASKAISGAATDEEIEERHVVKPAWKVEVAKGKLAIHTLEAIALPLLALDTEGNELFLNEEWIKLQRVYGAALSSPELMEQTRQAVAKDAIRGTLNVDKVWRLHVPLKDKNLFVRRIRDEKNIIIGYLFWAPEAPVEINSALPKVSPAAIDMLSEKYEGKSFQEVIQAEEKKLLLWAYQESGESMTNAAALLGMPRQTFSYKFHKYFKTNIAEKV